MDWKNLLLGAVGVVAAPYTGGASLALVSAAVANHANQSTASQLTKAGEQAQTVNQQTRDQNLARVQPWVNTGLGANSTLQNLFGLPAPSSGGTTGEATPATTPATMPTTDPNTASAYEARKAGGPPETMAQDTANKMGTLADVARQQTRSGYVRMKAPNGDEEDVPAALVEHYKALQAVPIGVQ